MTRRIPENAFEYYVGLGGSRSHQAVADHFGVTKRAVTKLATKDRWKERVLGLEKKARSAADERALESLEAMNLRHLRSLKIIQGKALDALKGTSLATAMEAVRALTLSIKQERVIRGEPGDRSTVSVEDVIKREFDRWMDGESDEDDSEARPE